MEFDREAMVSEDSRPVAMNEKKDQKSVVLSVEKLVLYGGNTEILKGIDWEVSRGEHWAILGANGCGKSSLLAAILAYRPAAKGEICLLGERYGRFNWPELRKRIGMVSSVLSYRVPAEETALETVLSGEAAQLGFWSRSETVNGAKALQCLEEMGVRRLADRRWAVLSQGERQKVFIARALMQDPAMLILDEPCAGLDPVAREQFLVSLRKLAQRESGPTLLFVTHHVEEIFPEISHVLVLQEGRVLGAGVKEDVLESELLSRAFGAPVTVENWGQDRWRLTPN
ncbi:iron complex transport system ATP-binding protein [Puniceicoccus vermicola]